MSEELTTAEPVSMPDRIASYLASEDPPTDEIDDSTEAQPEEALAEGESQDEPVAAAEEAPQDEEELEITWNGEAKRLKKSEALDLAQKGFDYTQKTQQLAEARKRFEADVQALQQSTAVQSALQEQIAEVRSLDRQIEAFKGVNWHELAEQDPVQYLKLNQSYRDLKEARESKVQEVQGLGQQFQQSQSMHMQQVLQRESEALANKVPAFAGEKRAESVTQLRSFLAESGFSDSEIAGVVDHRAVTMAWKAMQYDKLQKSKPATDKKVANLPKPVKPGVSASKGQQQSEAQQNLRQQLRRTGKIPSGLLAKYL